MRIREVVILSILALLVFSIYSNILGGPFVFDDEHNILDNSHIRITELSWESVKEAALEGPCSNRPVAKTSFALNYYFHQYDVFGYHLVNILIHIATGILLYFFVKTTLSLPLLASRYGPPGWIALFTALIWLVHPIQTQSVAYVVQRMNSMAAMFYILSFLLYVKARLAEAKKVRWALFAGCALSGVLAVGSKEIAATLPFFFILFEWYFFQDLSRDWLKRHAFFFAGMLILFALVAFVYLGADPLGRILAGYETRDFTLIQRVLTESQVVIFYISLLLFPHPSRLNLTHDFSLSYSLIDPITTLLSFGAILGLIGLAFYLAKKERLISFCILWFFGNLVIESSVIGLEIIFEHRNYLPSMFVSLMAVTLVYRLIKSKRVTIAALCAIVTVFFVWTYQRNNVWGDEVTLWTDCAKKSPKIVRPHNNLGNALVDQERFDEAMHHFSEALKIEPDFANVHYNMGSALNRQGKYREAISHYSEAIKIDPEYEEAHFNLGNVLARQGRLEEAMAHFSEALKIKPDYAEAHFNLGNALTRLGQPEEAIDHFIEALKIRPEYAEAHYDLGITFARQGRLEEAIDHFSEAIKINPEYVEAHFNLGNALARQGMFEEARDHFSEALKIEPNHMAARRGVEAVLRILGTDE
ncbi:MAG: tetratricopeptide repeat protein [Desulfuromonadales bacterium]|nr:tetratricopeptide repeat protein [Desulfuromonadales bacterium]